MGVLNRTPDSFSDGGKYVDEDAAAARIDAMLDEGAAIIDVGAESTRPGAEPVSAAEQIARLGGAVREAVSRGSRGALVSIDTTLPEVAARALDDGASIVNTTSLDPAAELGALAASYGASLVLMHSRGPMRDMKGFSAYPDDAYGDVVASVSAELVAAADRAVAAGLDRSAIVLDPGLGFAKNARHSMELCARLDEIVALGYPVLVGASNKSFLASASLGARSSSPADRATRERGVATHVDRVGGSIAAAILCAERGASILRVHDVAATAQALAVARALAERRRPSAPRTSTARPEARDA